MIHANGTIAADGAGTVEQRLHFHSEVIRQNTRVASWPDTMHWTSLSVGMTICHRCVRPQEQHYSNICISFRVPYDHKL